MSSKFAISLSTSSTKHIAHKQRALQLLARAAEGSLRDA
ncbi:hypothetical protein ACLB1O_16430 [Escherichia coli]